MLHYVRLSLSLSFFLLQVNDLSVSSFMKYLLLAFLLLIVTASSAQQSIEQALKGKANAEEPSLSAYEAVTLIDKEVYVCDTVYGFKIVNDTLKMIFLGKKGSKHVLTVILKGKDTRLEPNEWEGSKICVSGMVILYNGRPTIIVNNWGQLGTRIQI